MNEQKIKLINLKAIREQFGLTQIELADRIGTTQQEISKYENCEQEPDLTILFKIAECLQTSVYRLVGEKQMKKRKGNDKFKLINLRLTRLNCELTKEELAKLIDVKLSTIEHLEYKQGWADLSLANKIAECLNTTIESLTTESELSIKSKDFVNLKAIREKCGLTQIELAEKAGIALSLIPKFEHLKSHPSERTGIKIAKCLGVKYSDLVGDKEDCPNRTRVYLANLGSLRTDLGITQATIANFVGVASTQISIYERCAARAEMQTAIKIASVLDTNVDQLIGEKPCQDLYRRVYLPNLKIARINKNMTTAELAKASGIGLTAYLSYEEGKRMIYLHKANKLANILGVTVDALAGKEELPIIREKLEQKRTQKVYVPNLKTIREEQGMTQDTLAKLIGCTHQRISKYETGCSISSRQQIEKLAECLHTSVDCLIGTI